MKALEDWPVLTPEERVSFGLARRPPKPDITVAARHDEVLDMWAEDNPFGPHEIPATSPAKVRWRCPKGHTFIESAVVQCGAVSAWRVAAGGSRACVHCYEDSRSDMVRLACGHAIPARHAEDGGTECWTCKHDEVRNARALARAAARSTPRFPLGTVVQSRSSAVSKTERQVRDKLVESGLTVHKGRSAIQCGSEPLRGNFPILTPDIIISKTKVCVEVDPAYTHAEKETVDKTRNNLLAAVGWQVVRLRLGGLEPIGEHDVVVESENVTKEAITALVAAVADAVAGRPGTVRRILKKSSPIPKNKKSRLGAIAAHKYYDNAFYISWTLESGGVVRMVAMDSGRYLAGSEGWEAPRFIRHLGLHNVPRTQWRGRLEPLLEDMGVDDFAPASTFPWGDRLFVGSQANAIRLPPKFHIGMSEWSITANVEGADTWTPVSLCAKETELVRLHPEAVNAGWRIKDVQFPSGRYGAYQAIHLTRVDEREGDWV